MVGTMHGTHEDIEYNSRLRNKQIMLINYKEIFNIILYASEVNNTVSIIDRIEIVMDDLEATSEIRFDCNVAIPTSLYMVFEADYFNKLQPNNRYQTFKNLIDYINKGH